MNLQYLSKDPIFCKLNVKHIRLRCSFSNGHIIGSFSIANSCKNKKQKIDIFNFIPNFIDLIINGTCFAKSGVKSGKPVIVELPPVIEFDLFPFPLLLDKLFENILFLCCNCAPGALLVLLCELLEPILDVLADSQLSLLPFCN